MGSQQTHGLAEDALLHSRIVMQGECLHGGHAGTEVVGVVGGSVEGNIIHGQIAFSRNTRHSSRGRKRDIHDCHSRGGKEELRDEHAELCNVC